MSRESRGLMAAVSALVAVGIVVLFSASAFYAERARGFGGDPYFFLKRQVLSLAIGMAAALLAYRIRPETWRRYSWLCWAATILLLLLVLVPGLGTRHNTGARRWLNLGTFAFQPSEIAKLTASILLASFLSGDPDRAARWRKGFLPSILIIGVTCGLILVEPDVGTSLLLASVLALTLWVGGAKLRHFAPFALVALIGLSILFSHQGYIRQRFDAWRDPWSDETGKGHQIRQSLIALGSGGWTGEGLGQGTQKLLYLPERHTDFLLAILGEELGLIGSLGVLFLFGLVGWFGWRITRKCRSRFSALLSFALTSNIILQAALNMAVVTAAIPTKGIPLPFLSFGGSSLIMGLVGVGLLIRISETESQGSEVAERERGRCASSLPAAVPEGTSSPGSP